MFFNFTIEVSSLLSLYIFCIHCIYAETSASFTTTSTFVYINTKLDPVHSVAFLFYIQNQNTIRKTKVYIVQMTKQGCISISCLDKSVFFLFSIHSFDLVKCYKLRKNFHHNFLQPMLMSKAETIHCFIFMYFLRKTENNHRYQFLECEQFLLCP